MSLPRITDAFVCTPGCPRCGGCGHVCEAHPERAWGGIADGGCDCGAPGVPCRTASREGKWRCAPCGCVWMPEPTPTRKALPPCPSCGETSDVFPATDDEWLADANDEIPESTEEREMAWRNPTRGPAPWDWNGKPRGRRRPARSVR